MSETEIKAAIAEQEEHLKRIEGCGGVYLAPHSFDRFAAAPGVFYRACLRCRVTETREDYAVRISE